MNGGVSVIFINLDRCRDVVERDKQVEMEGNTILRIITDPAIFIF